MTPAGALLATIPLFSALAAPPSEPLDADVVDTSAFPSVSIDVVVPPPLRSLTISPEMIELAGGTVESVAPVDPTAIVVGLVIDDSPSVPAFVVTDAQGASVELVRNVGTGTKIALSTPSGLLSALTSDRNANISRIAGITAGAPDVMPLPSLILDAATRLAASAEIDRHLVLVLGSAPTVDLAALADVVEADDITVHVVAPDNVDVTGLAELAASTGGVAPSVPGLVGEIDVATAAIAQRHRIQATVDGAGPRELAVVVDGVRHAATVDVAQPAAPPSTTAAATASPATDPAPTTAASRASAPATPTSTPAAAVADDAEEEEGGSSRAPVVIGAVVALIVLVGAATLLARRRRGDDATAVAPQPLPEPVPVTVVEEAAPMAAAVSAPRTQRVTAPSRPRRSVTTRRPEPAPPPEPTLPVQPPPRPVFTREEWLVSGDLRLRRATGEVWNGTRSVSLTPAELGVLELLMTSGDRGVTPEAIAEAAGHGVDNGESVDPDAVLAQLRRKTRIAGRTRRVRRERVMLYFLDDDDDPGGG